MIIHAFCIIKPSRLDYWRTTINGRKKEKRVQFVIYPKLLYNANNRLKNRNMLMEKWKTELIVMLTHNDCTITNAFDIFDQCKNSQANFFGVKEKGLPLEEMKRLLTFMKMCGKKTVLEVISQTEEECLAGAKLANECGVDIFMGTMFFDSVNEFCQQNHLKYLPFVGVITGHPSILEGTIEAMIEEAQEYLKKGVYGFDLLGYRYTGDAEKLIQKFVAEVNAPVCIAGSIDSYEKLAEVKNSNAWAFTIGGAFFENKFGKTYNEQINKVFAYINANEIGD